MWSRLIDGGGGLTEGEEAEVGTGNGSEAE